MLASDGVTYVGVIIYCYCSKHEDGAPMFRNNTAKALTIDTLRNNGEHALADYYNLHGITSSAMRHAVAGDDSILWLGCADENNKRQREDDPAPARSTVRDIHFGSESLADKDKEIRDNDDAELERRRNK